MSNQPVYKIINGELVRKEGDERDPVRRYRAVGGADGTYNVEFTDEEELQRDEEEARWVAEAPQRDLEEKRQQAEAEAFRASLKYERRLVAFVDILGWSGAVTSSNANLEQTQKLGLALNAIRQVTKRVDWMAENSGDDKWPGDLRATYFSDCLVISAEDDFSGKHSLISTLGFLSNSLIYHGFVLRGGIALGDLYHQDGMVFGPALIQAYQLESRCAIYPRIILERAIAAVWNQGDVIFDKDGSQIGQYRTWRLSSDGYRFLDFLQPLGGFPDFNQTFLQPIKQFLEEKLNEYQGNNSILPKYIWLANYFNEVCLEHVGCGIDQIGVPDGQA